MIDRRYMEHYITPYWANCKNCEEKNDEEKRINTYILLENEGYCKICGETIFFIGPTKANIARNRVNSLREANISYKEVKA